MSNTEKTFKTVNLIFKAIMWLSIVTTVFAVINLNPVALISAATAYTVWKLGKV